MDIKSFLTLGPGWGGVTWLSVILINEMLMGNMPVGTNVYLWVDIRWLWKTDTSG